MNRGNHQGSIFEDDVDRGIFLRTLEETSLASGWVAHSFVLMGNHYHFEAVTCREIRRANTGRHEPRHHVGRKKGGERFILEKKMDVTYITKRCLTRMALR